MTPTLLATIILIVTVILFFTPKVPNSVTAVIGTIAMGLSGILPVKTVFNYYTSTTCILMIGMMIIGGGMMHTGFAGWLGNKLIGMTGKGEKNLRLAAVLAGWIMSSLASGSASMMILYPIICSICIASQVSMSRIMFPMFAGIGFGSLMTVAGSGMCGATSAILEEAGFAVEVAQDGKVAVEMLVKAGADHYQLVLMDVQMPVMDGYQATRAIRQLEDKALASIPILAMTANAFEEDKQEALRSGMDGHIAKPIDIKKLIETLDRVLAQKR